MINAKEELLQSDQKGPKLMVTIAVFDLAFKQPIGFLFATRDISYRIWKAILGIQDLTEV